MLKEHVVVSLPSAVDVDRGHENRKFAVLGVSEAAASKSAFMNATKSLPRVDCFDNGDEGVQLCELKVSWLEYFLLIQSPLRGNEFLSVYDGPK